jgi:hypothetical protein
MMTKLLWRFFATAALAVMRLRQAVCCLAACYILCACVGCSPAPPGKAILPNPDEVPPPSSAPMDADPATFERRPIVVD